ncbi:hypothetical protein [uncultured Flavobacterium sp.]|uniref:hypothetical protein n=1 Tax=uncultured Flavobacterium sp. TaxID=165435 RepID=UPI001219FD21|nr:hypothetical protein [uncultured Flavobacterium sp.]THD30158.1 MAG: hypothetical protein DI588_17275 [Flavobacterium johnsoniae]
MDLIGVLDPTGIVDGLNAIGYLARGQNTNAMIAAVGIVPYIGDLGKLTKYTKSSLKTGTGLIDDVADVLSKGDYLRIQNAATRINKPITVVGSRASGTAKAYSDWDYVVPGLKSKNWSTIKNSLPGSRSTLDNTPRNIDIFKGPLDPTKPHIIINPDLK